MNTLKKQVYAASLLILVACGSKKEEPSAVVAPVQRVQTTKVVSLRQSRNVELPGELKPWNKTSIYARVNGYVGAIYADRGTKVTKGQPLAKLDAPEVESELANLMAKASAAEAALSEQKARSRASTLQHERLLKTSKTQGAVSPNELDQAYAKRAADSAMVVSLENSLKAVKAQQAAHKQLVDYLTIRAAFDGTIIERNASPGDIVGPSAGSSKPIFVLEDQQKLRLTVAIPEYLSKSVQEGTEVAFYVTTDPATPYRAVFGRTSNSIMETNRSMLTEFDADNSAGKLKPGMYAEVSIPMERSEPTLFVPTTSVISSPEGKFVVRLKQNVAEWVPVRDGFTQDGLVEVFGALAEGDLIVLQASEELRKGTTVALDN